jgi:hypothetical protein
MEARYYRRRRVRGVKGDRREWVRVVVQIYLKIFDGIEVLPKVEKGRTVSPKERLLLGQTLRYRQRLRSPQGDRGVKGDRREWVRVVVEIYEDI